MYDLFLKTFGLYILIIIFVINKSYILKIQEPNILPKQTNPNLIDKL